MRRWILRISICVLLGVVTTVAVAWGCVIRWERQSPEARDKVQLVVRSDSGSIAPDWDKPVTWFEEVAGCFESSQSPSNVIRISADLRRHGLWRSLDVKVSREEFSEFLPAWSRLRVEEPVDTMPGMDLGWRSMFCEIGAGWPWLALRGEYVVNFYVDAAGSFVWRFPMRSGIVEVPVKDRYGSDSIIVPFRPIWPGFMGSVILYGSAWLMVLTMPGVLRRRLRRRRGRCVRCNYDLRGHNPNGPHPRPLSPGERGVIGCPECGWGRSE